MAIEDVTVSDVENLSSTGWTQLEGPGDAADGETSKKEFLLQQAKNEATGIYSARVSTLPTIVGNREDFVTYLAAHKWELAEGGESQSESSQGGSVNYNNPSGDAELNLTQTRYGREAWRYLRDNTSTGVVRYR